MGCIGTCPRNGVKRSSTKSHAFRRPSYTQDGRDRSQTCVDAPKLDNRNMFSFLVHRYMRVAAVALDA